MAEAVNCVSYRFMLYLDQRVGLSYVQDMVGLSSDLNGVLLYNIVMHE